MTYDQTDTPDDARSVDVHGVHGRDRGKTFTVLEIDPLTLAGYGLRINSALRIPSYLDMLERWKAAADDGEAPIDLMLLTLQGGDPIELKAIITELLDYVRVSPDPQHPGVRRKLLADNSDIREIRTLGDVLMALLKLNFTSQD